MFLQMALRVRKVFGAFEKRAPDPRCAERMRSNKRW